MSHVPGERNKIWG